MGKSASASEILTSCLGLSYIVHHRLGPHLDQMDTQPVIRLQDLQMHSRSQSNDKGRT